MDFSQRLKELRKEKGINQQTLADALCVDKSSVSKWEHGANYPNQNIIEMICDYFGVSVDYLLGRSDDNGLPQYANVYPLDEHVKIPALGIIRGGQPICTEQGEYEEVWADKKFGDGKHFMLKVQGDSMSPTIPNGAWAIIEQTDCVEPGKIVAFALDGEYATLKRYYPQADGSVILKGDNPKQTFEFHITAEQLANGEAHIIGVCRHVKFDL